MYIAFFLFVPMALLIVFIGLVMHATFNDCDPLVTKKIKTANEVSAYLAHIPVNDLIAKRSVVLSNMYS